MARRCQITGKGTRVGKTRSHSNRGTKRTFRVNLVTKRLMDPVTGAVKRVRIAASTLRTITKYMR